eukprot:564601_1
MASHSSHPKCTSLERDKYRWTHLRNTWITYDYRMKPSQLKEENTISWEIHFQGKLKRFDNTYRTVVPFVKAYGTHYSLESTYAVLDPSTCAGIQKFGTSKRIHEALRKKHVQILDQIKQEISVQLTAKQSTTSHTKRIRKRRTQSIPNVHSSALFLGVYYMLQCVQNKSLNTHKTNSKTTHSINTKCPFFGIVFGCLLHVAMRT